MWCKRFVQGHGIQTPTMQWMPENKDLTRKLTQTIKKFIQKTKFEMDPPLLKRWNIK